jgi:hypothetical protein
VQLDGFLRDAVEIVSHHGVDHENRDASLGELIAEGPDFGRALAGDGAFIGGEEKHDCFTAKAAQFMEPPLVIDQGKVENFTGLSRMSFPFGSSGKR